MRFIHIADVHLGCCPENKFAWGADRGKELWDSFAAVIDACNEKQIELLLIAGDLFDHVPLWEELERVNHLFSMLQETEVVLIAGDCDYVSEDSAWREFPWSRGVHVLTGRYPESIFLEALDVSVTGCSYQEPVVTKPYLEDAHPDNEGEIQILLGHTGDGSHMPADPEELAGRGFDYIALGHLHQPRLMAKQRMAYAGSLEPLKQSESGKHGFIIGEITEEGTNIRFIPFACREYISVKVRLSGDVTQAELEERLALAMERSGENNMFRIRLEGHFKPGCRLDEKRLMALGNVTELINETTPDYNFMSLLSQHKDDLIGMYLEEFLQEPMDKLQQRALYCGLEALLAGRDTEPQA